MTVRWLNLVTIAALVLAAAYVYKIKFESTVQAERLAKLRAEIARERDAVAALRAEWSKTASPARIQALAQRHLALKPLDPRQIIESADRIPERPVDDAQSAVAGRLQPPRGDASDPPTGSIGAPAARR
jgi:hypothetical protein